MTTRWVFLLFGLLGGLAGGLQGPLSAVLGRHVGVMGSVFLVHLGGTLGAAMFLFLPGASELNRWRDVPAYALGAGLLGLVLIGAFTVCIPRLGAAGTVTVVVLGQLIVGVTLDHFGWVVALQRSLDLTRVLGLGLVLLGTWFVVRV